MYVPSGTSGFGSAHNFFADFPQYILNGTFHCPLTERYRHSGIASVLFLVAGHLMTRRWLPKIMYVSSALISTRRLIRIQGLAVTVNCETFRRVICTV